MAQYLNVLVKLQNTPRFSQQGVVEIPGETEQIKKKYISHPLSPSSPISVRTSIPGPQVRQHLAQSPPTRVAAFCSYFQLKCQKWLWGEYTTSLASVYRSFEATGGTIVKYHVLIDKLRGLKSLLTPTWKVQ